MDNQNESIVQNNQSEEGTLYIHQFKIENVCVNDFYTLSSKLQPLFAGKKHYEMIMIISVSDQIQDLSEHQLQEEDQIIVDKQWRMLKKMNDKLLEGSEFTQLSTKKEIKKKSTTTQNQETAYFLLQYSSRLESKINILIKKIDEKLNTKTTWMKQISRSTFFFKNSLTHSSFYQYPEENKIPLTNLTYGILKTDKSPYFKIWDLSFINQFSKQNIKVISQEFVHKINFKKENEYFVFFTLCLNQPNYFISFKVQVSIEDFYIFNDPQSNEKQENCILFLKLIGFPKISKSSCIRSNQYFHYDFLNWNRIKNFFLGKMNKFNNLIKMQIMKDHVFALQINKKYLIKNKNVFENIIKSFNSEKKLELLEHQLQEYSFFQSPLSKVTNLLGNYLNQIQDKLKFYLAKLISSGRIQLEQFDSDEIWEIISKNQKNVILLFKLLYFKPEEYKIEQHLLKQLKEWCQYKDKKELKKEIKGYKWFPSNFCLINKIIITPSLVIYGQEELIPLCFNFKKQKKYYKKNAVIYLRDEGLEQFDFEETQEEFFIKCFKKYSNNIQIAGLSDFLVQSYTSKSLQKNCLFAVQERQFLNSEFDEESFLNTLLQYNLNFTFPIYSINLDLLYIQKREQPFGFINNCLLSQIFYGMGYNIYECKFSSIVVRLSTLNKEDGLDFDLNHTCTLFYNLMDDTYPIIRFYEDTQNEQNQNDNKKSDKSDNRIMKNVLIQIFYINECKKGFINQTNLENYIEKNSDLIKQSIQNIHNNKNIIENLEVSPKLELIKNEVQKSKLDYYEYNNIYPLDNSYILSGRKANCWNENKKGYYEHIIDKSKMVQQNQFQVQLKVNLNNYSLNILILFKQFVKS